MVSRLRKATPEQRQALAHLLERQQRGEDGLPPLELLQAVGAIPEVVRRKQELRGEELTRYKALGRLLNDLEGVVVASRVSQEGQGYCLRYGVSAAGVEWVERGLWG